MKIDELTGRKIGGIDFFTSAECQMKCKYCYIPKGEQLKRSNKKIKAALMDGSMIETAKKTLDIDAIKGVSFWGAEPLINIKEYEYFVPDLFSNIKQLDNIGFSTNMLMGSSPVIKFINIIDEQVRKYNKEKFNLRIQISLDGYEEITDTNRHKGATKVIIKSYKEILKYLNDNDIQTQVYFPFKPTLSTENMKDMTKDNMIKWFKLFESLQDDYLEIVEEKNRERVTTSVWATTPTIVMAGNHTIEDGKIFARWLKDIYSIDTEKEEFKYMTQPLFSQHFSTLDRVISNSWSNEISSMFGQIPCSAGDSFAIGPDDNVFLCHRSFGEYYPDFSSKDAIVNKNIKIVHDDLEKARVLYMLRGFKDFPAMKFAYTNALLKSMAMTGQVEDIYLDNDKMSEMMTYMLSGLNCFMDNVYETTSLNITMLSMVRMYGNGALQELLKAYYTKVWNKGEMNK